MATRDENLKKINVELEQLSDEELENVAGGTYNNTAADTRLLNQLGYDIEGKSALELFWIPSFHSSAKKVSEIFSGLGISVDQSWGAVQNRYYKDGKEISRAEAFRIAAEKKGKPIPSLDY